MKKGLKVTLIVFLSLISIVLAFFLIGSSYQVYKNTGINDKWMSKVDGNTKINEIIIPGTHDSGTYKMMYAAECQNFSVEQQLDIGVRYFDLRIKYDSKHDKYRMYHGPISGVEFDPILDSIVNFLKVNPTEFLILDFQHFDNAKDYVLSQINLKLINYCVKNETEKSDLEFVDDLKLNDVRGKCLVIFGNGTQYTDLSYIFDRNNDECSSLNRTLDSCYYTERNNKSSKEYINESLPYYVDRIKEKIENEGYKGLFVLQGQLTDSLFIFGPCQRERFHSKNMSNFVNNLPNEDYFDLINIIIRDFVDETKVNEIIELNKIKGIMD